MPQQQHKPLLLCILDGYGLNPNPKANGVAMAKKPHLDALFANNPYTRLTTHGERVGLPAGQMGNSEVGHMNIGAGRVVDQLLLKISKALKDGDGIGGQQAKAIDAFAQNLSQDKGLSQDVGLPQEKTLHLIGMYSAGGVHSHNKEHLHQLIARVRSSYLGKIAIHIITDGRDCPPNQGVEEVRYCEAQIAGDKECFIATVCGRFYAMDRDKRWERTKLAYDAIANGLSAPQEQPKDVSCPVKYLLSCYEQNVTDEFLLPAVFNNYKGVSEWDSVIFWNFREDRMRQIVQALCIKEPVVVDTTKSTEANNATTNNTVVIGFEREFIPFNKDTTLCFTEYHKQFGLPVVFKDEPIVNHLGEVLSKHQIPQLRVAESEKYPHVTYFINCGIEKPYPLEDRVLVPSTREVKTYDQRPQMSAFGVKDAVIEGIRSGKYQYIVVNFANCDMVGHTAVPEAVIKAVETVDQCVSEILTALKENNWQAIITADHGNAEQMIHYDTGEPHTSHTTYLVPCVIYGAEGFGAEGYDTKGSLKLREDGALCDLAPTILKLMELDKPKEMTGEGLIA